MLVMVRECRIHNRRCCLPVVPALELSPRAMRGVRVESRNEVALIESVEH